MVELLRRRSDVALAAALVALVVAELVARRLPGDELAVLLPAGVVAAGAVAWRRRRPVLAAAVVIAAWVTAEVAVDPADDPIAHVIAIVVALYSAGAHSRPSAGAALVVAATAAATATEPSSGFWDVVGSIVFFGWILGGAWAAGVAMRFRRGREVQLVLQSDERARAAIVDERARIARELHDVVAHAISVIVLQARGARHALDDDPAAARAAIDAIDETGRDALVEMRRLLAVLRQDDEEIAMAPQPSLAQLDRLVESVRAAGMPVDLRVEGEPAALPPGIDLSAYRIVQEALTNVLKHAGPARIQVVVRYEPDRLELEILDDGAARLGGESTGRGLIGMRERVAVFGGELEAGRRGSGGYALRARLPLAAGSS